LPAVKIAKTFCLGSKAQARATRDMLSAIVALRLLQRIRPTSFGAEWKEQQYFAQIAAASVIG
jgi:hypothetical protein